MSRWSGLALALWLALGLLAACGWWAYRELAVTLRADPILPSLLLDGPMGWTMTARVAAFFAAALLVHALLGVASFALARLTEAAVRRRSAVLRRWLVIGWFVALGALVLAANAAWYPGSAFAPAHSRWAMPVAGSMSHVELAALGLALAIVLLAWRAWPRLRGVARSAAVPALALTAFFGGSLLPDAWFDRPQPGNPARPHLVIIGLDSVRKDLSLPRLGPAPAPEIRRFLEDARTFSDVTSPLPRTYGSWVSILTGRHPVATNARVNLMPRELVQAGDTLPQALRATGYRTIYATDETRFANFDASFGFDQQIVPPPGAADFLLGHVGDLPLVNLATATPFARWLFPSNHANRAAEVTYRPEAFLARIAREATFGEPTALTVHLTLAHWPYAWAGRAVPTRPDQYRASYADAVAEVDRQFGALMRLLQARGVLDNAVVVLLSDHGEALGDEGDSMLRATGTSREIWDSLWGHGTSVMSPHQYQVLLAVRAFGQARLPGPAQDYHWPVSLEDLRPTLQELMTGWAPADVDGRSLLPYMRDPGRAYEIGGRIRFTETDFNTPSTLAGRYSVSGILNEALAYYEIDPATGWVQFRPDRLPALLAQKQRAAISQDSLLAAIPGPSGGQARLLYTGRRDPRPVVLDGPSANWEPEARRLWQALALRFPGELSATLTVH